MIDHESIIRKVFAEHTFPRVSITDQRAAYPDKLPHFVVVSADETDRHPETKQMGGVGVSCADDEFAFIEHCRNAATTLRFLIEHTRDEVFGYDAAHAKLAEASHEAA